MPRITPPDDAIVQYSGLYWHYGHSASGRGIWRARLTVDPNGEVSRRTKEGTAKADHLLGLWLMRGELPVVRAWRWTHFVEELGHYRKPMSGESFPPFACELCGCLVSDAFLTVHRKGCQPGSPDDNERI